MAASSRDAHHHHDVYVVDLSDHARNVPTFRRANPDCRLERLFVYVDMTVLDPDLRFDTHKAGIQANRFVLEYCLQRLPSLYEVYNPLPYEPSRDGSGARDWLARAGLPIGVSMTKQEYPAFHLETNTKRPDVLELERAFWPTLLHLFHGSR